MTVDELKRLVAAGEMDCDWSGECGDERKFVPAVMVAKKPGRYGTAGQMTFAPSDFERRPQAFVTERPDGVLVYTQAIHRGQGQWIIGDGPPKPSDHYVNYFFRRRQMPTSTANGEKDD